MASNNNRLAIGLVSLVVLVGVGLLVLSQAGYKYDWTETWNPNGMEPYELGLLTSLLEDSPGSEIEVMQSSVKELPQEGNYLFIGNEMFMNEEEVDSLFAFVRRGNDAFIAAEQLPIPFLQAFNMDYGSMPHCQVDTFTLYFNFDVNAFPEDSNNLYFNFTYASQGNLFYRQWCETSWRSIWAIDSIADTTEILGYGSNANPSFLRIEMGEGNIYLHTNPITFTNFFLKDSAGYQHAEICFSRLEQKPFYFDLYSRVFREDNYPSNRDSSTPMKYVFSQPALRNAWYVLLFSVVLFLLFRSKRQQRAIPIIPKVENTSIEFAKALGTLYMQSNSPRHLAQEMMIQFHNHNRRTYGIQQQKKGSDMIDLIAKKSKVDVERLRKIFSLESELNRTESQQMNKVVPLYEALQYYYQNARK